MKSTVTRKFIKNKNQPVDYSDTLSVLHNISYNLKTSIRDRIELFI